MPLNGHKTHENTKDDTSIVKQYFDLIESEFGKDSIMLKIAACESNAMQYEIVDNTIKVLRGRLTPADVGIFQISMDWHENTIDKLGYNIYTPTGNIQYAKYLYDRYGTRPWNWSKSCWDK